MSLATEDVYAWEDPSGVPEKWWAYSDATLVLGWGDDRDAALANYREHCRDDLERLLELGPERVSASLWRTVPALQKALGLTSQ